MTSEIPQSAMMSAPMPHPGMMPPNGYMGGYSGMSMMPSTSNNMMSNFSMDDPNMRNSGSPMMLQGQNYPSPGPSNFLPGHPQFPSSMASFHPQNPPQYSSNGQPPFQNPNIPPYFSNQQQQPQIPQQIPSNSSPSRLNTPNYPPSNASNANNTPTYPNHTGTPTYPNPPPNQMQQQQQPNLPSYQNNSSQQLQNYPSMNSEFLPGQDVGNNGTEIMQQQSYQNNEEGSYNNTNNNNNNNNFINRDMNNGFTLPPVHSGAPFQRQMSTPANMMGGGGGVGATIKKTTSTKTMLFNTDMFNEMLASCKEGNNPENWHATHAPQINGTTKPQRKRKAQAAAEASPSYVNANMASEFNMREFQQSPMSNHSLPDINTGMPIMNGSQMPSDNYGPKKEKKDDETPLQSIERMTQLALDPTPPKVVNRGDTCRKQDDKRKKMEKLEMIENDLLADPMQQQQMMGGMPPRVPHPSMMMQMQMRPPYPGFDPSMPPNQMRPMNFPPGHPMFGGQMPPGFIPPQNPALSQNGMMPSYNGMASASPKFPMMGGPPMMSPQQGNMPPQYQMAMERGMRPPPPAQMNEIMWHQQQHQHRQFLLHQQHQFQQQQLNGQMPL